MKSVVFGSKRVIPTPLRNIRSGTRKSSRPAVLRLPLPEKSNQRWHSNRQQLTGRSSKREVRRPCIRVPGTRPKPNARLFVPSVGRSGHFGTLSSTTGDLRVVCPPNSTATDSCREKLSTQVVSMKDLRATEEPSLVTKSVLARSLRIPEIVSWSQLHSGFRVGRMWPAPAKTETLSSERRDKPC